MTSPDKLPDTIKRNPALAWAPFIAMYLIWSGISLAAVFMGRWGWGGPVMSFFVLPVSIGLYLVLAVFISQVFLVYVDGVLEDAPRLRKAMLAVSVGVALAVYLVMRDGTVKNVFLSSLGTVNLIVFACVVGTWMAHSIKRPSELVPICGVVAIADLFSVFAGPTRQMVEGLKAFYEKGMQGPPPLTDFILIKISVPGMGPALPLFGVSDWIILVFLCAALAKFGLNDNLAGSGIRGMAKRKRLAFYFPAAALGLLGAIVTVHLTGMFLPALPFVVLGFLVHAMVFHPQVRSLNKREWVLLSGFSSVMIFLLVAGLILKNG